MNTKRLAIIDNDQARNTSPSSGNSGMKGIKGRANDRIIMSTPDTIIFFAENR